MNINDIKNGMTIILDGNLCQIVEFQHVKPGKGSAFVRMKTRNLRTGAIVENSYNTNIKIERARMRGVNSDDVNVIIPLLIVFNDSINCEFVINSPPSLIIIFGR